MKCKSQEQLNNIAKPKKKGKKPTKKVRTLVAHPPIPKDYPKATTKGEKQLTKYVKTTISGSRKYFDKENQYEFGSPAGKDHIEKKKR